LCLHTLSTLCSIDFELRHTFSPRSFRQAGAHSALTARQPHAITAPQSVPIFPTRASRELKCNSSDPISDITRVSFDSQEILPTNF
jgi:hypothetical protein